MIERWNEKVGAKDHVYYLGDFSHHKTDRTREILDQLKGRIYFIKGNHDRSATRTICHDRYEWIKDYHYLKIEDIEIALMHYCLRIWDKKHHGSWHLFGHSHSNLKEVKGEMALNVGVDCWDFYPVSLEEVKERMQKFIVSEDP